MQVGNPTEPDDDPLSFVDDVIARNDCVEEVGDKACDPSVDAAPVVDGTTNAEITRADSMREFDEQIESQKDQTKELCSASQGRPDPTRPSFASLESDAGLTYTEICRALRRRVTGYDTAIRELALVFDARWRQASGGIAERILLVGPTGAGKSHLLRALAESLNLPCVVIDASQLSESGWQGVQPADVVAKLYDAVGHSVESLSEGRVLLCFDEFDKLCAPGGTARRVADAQSVAVREGRQQSLLSILGGLTPVQFTATPPARASSIAAVHATVAMAVHTDRVPIVCAGAFPGLNVSAESPPTDRALRRYGMIGELASRLTTRIVLPPREPHDLVAMWRTEGGIVTDLLRGARALGFDLTVSDTVLPMIASAISAARSGLTPRAGAGILGAVVRRALSDALECDVRPSAIIITPDDVVSHLRTRPRRRA